MVWPGLCAGNSIMKSFITDYMWQVHLWSNLLGGPGQKCFVKQSNKDLPYFSFTGKIDKDPSYSDFMGQSDKASPYSVFMEQSDRTSPYSVSTGQTVRDSPWSQWLVWCGSERSSRGQARQQVASRPRDFQRSTTRTEQGISLLTIPVLVAGGQFGQAKFALSGDSISSGQATSVN